VKSFRERPWTLKVVAAKASRMKCVIVPDPHQYSDNRWHAADIKLNALSQLNSQHFMTLNK
jgi:sugar-phosphatase